MKNSTIVKVVFVAAILMVGMQVNAQVAINATGDGPLGSAMLDVSSTTMGILIPRMLSTEIANIADPTDGLLVYQTDGVKGIYFYDGSFGGWKYQGATTWSSDLNGINYLGKVGIGTTSSSVYNLKTLGYSFNNYMASFENGIDNEFAWGIRVKAGPSSGFSANTRFIGFFKNETTLAGHISYDGTGKVVLFSSSDKNLKSDIKDTKYTLDDLMKLKVRDFKWKDSKLVSTGFIAQELYDIFPQAVSLPNEKSEYWMISEMSLIPIMVKSIQDQQMIIKSQEEKIKSLEDRLSAVEKLLAK